MTNEKNIISLCPFIRKKN